MFLKDHVSYLCLSLSVFNPAANWMEFFNFHTMWKITLQLHYFSLNNINKINTSALVLNSYQEGKRLHSLLPLKIINALLIMSRVRAFFDCEPKATLQNSPMCRSSGSRHSTERTEVHVTTAKVYWWAPSFIGASNVPCLHTWLRLVEVRSVMANLSVQLPDQL